MSFPGHRRARTVSGFRVINNKSYFFSYVDLPGYCDYPMAKSDKDNAPNPQPEKEPNLVCMSHHGSRYPGPEVTVDLDKHWCVIL